MLTNDAAAQWPVPGPRFPRGRGEVEAHSQGSIATCPEASTHQFLEFAIADRRLGLPTEVLQEVVRAVAIAPLPKAPPIVEGVINLRGTLVPVLDLRQRFGLPCVPVAPDQHLVIARAGRRVVALRVDRALALVDVEERAIVPPERVAPRTEYVAGIAALADGLLVIHDLERFLSLEEARQVDAVIDAAATRPDGRAAERSDPP
jgi:purine-binding chemotaxis protein CheW